MRSIVLTIFVIGVVLPTACNLRQRSATPSPTLALQQAPALNSIESLISSLSSPNDSVGTKTEKELIDLARQSPAQRADIIQKLLQSADSQDDLKSGRCIILESKFNYWSSVTNIFAELKATEAIDILITTIACGNGYTGSLLEEPSMDALIKLGKVAAPKLSKALKRERNEYVRIQLSRCLGVIDWHERHPG